MSSVGLLMRLYTGSSRDKDFVKRGAQYLADNLPSAENRDTYYWYYATQVMFHMGGDYWKRWNKSLHPMLAQTQIAEGKFAGSWSPRGDRWSSYGGRHYITTLNLLSLEVYYRILPIYDEAKR